MNRFFREIVAADFDALWAIEPRAYQFAWSQQILRDCLNARYPAWLMHDAEGTVMGYAFLSVGAGEAHLLNLAVAPEFQNRGVGRALLAYVLQKGEQMGLERMFLEVRPSNHAAINLYDEAGCNEIGRRPGYYPAPNGTREEAIVMAREYLGP